MKSDEVSKGLVDDTEMEEFDPEPAEQKKPGCCANPLAQLLMVASLLLVIIVGLILLVVFGAGCLANQARCGPAGIYGGIVMLVIGGCPFLLFSFLTVYNACYFKLGKGDEGNWIQLQF